MKKVALALIALVGTVGIAQAGAKDVGQREQPSKADRFIEAADQNADKIVTKDEYKAFLARKGEDSFAKLDANGDGSISKEEFLARISDNERTDRSFERFDLNKDGKIDLADRAEAGHRIKQRVGDLKTPSGPTSEPPTENKNPLR